MKVQLRRALTIMTAKLHSTDPRPCRPFFLHFPLAAGSSAYHPFPIQYLQKRTATATLALEIGTNQNATPDNRALRSKAAHSSRDFLTPVFHPALLPSFGNRSIIQKGCSQPFALLKPQFQNSPFCSPPLPMPVVRVLSLCSYRPSVANTDMTPRLCLHESTCQSGSSKRDSITHLPTRRAAS
jgi:hypothetical protein